MANQSTASVFCTLYEGDYHFGVASLLNSLIRNGFSGSFVIGYRGKPPPWIKDLNKREDKSFQIEGVHVVFEEIKTSWLLAHVKPQFMLDILNRISPRADSVFYADPDLVIDTDWEFFETWVSAGVAICEDCNFSSLPYHHYLRRSWKKYAQESLGLVVDDRMVSGFNSGFLGVKRREIEFLTTWKNALEGLEGQGVPLDVLKPGKRFDVFFGTDQDTLNIATMAHSEMIASIGTQGMGFSFGLTPMWHAVESVKPWREKYLLTLLRRGSRVSVAQKKYWQYVDGPIEAYQPFEKLLHLVDLYVAVALSRFYHIN